MRGEIKMPDRLQHGDDCLDSSEDVCPCENCGCTGNMTCGHPPPQWALDSKRGCALNTFLICPCCEDAENKYWKCNGGRRLSMVITGQGISSGVAHCAAKKMTHSPCNPGLRRYSIGRALKVIEHDPRTVKQAPSRNLPTR